MVKRFGVVTILLFFTEALLANAALASDNFGAIATSDSSNYWGLTYDHPSREKAESGALEQCSKNADDCMVRVWFQNACGSVADNGSSVSWGLGDTRAEAEANAMTELPDGKIIAWACTTR